MVLPGLIRPQKDRCGRIVADVEVINVGWEPKIFAKNTSLVKYRYVTEQEAEEIEVANTGALPIREHLERLRRNHDILRVNFSDWVLFDGNAFSWVARKRGSELRQILHKFEIDTGFGRNSPPSFSEAITRRKQMTRGREKSHNPLCAGTAQDNPPQ